MSEEHTRIRVMVVASYKGKLGAGLEGDLLLYMFLIFEFCATHTSTIKTTTTIQISVKEIRKNNNLSVAKN